jgi:hypothetical protein
LVSHAGKSRLEIFDLESLVVTEKENSSKELARDRGYWGYLAAQRKKQVHRTVADDVEELLDCGFSMHMVAELLQVGSTELMRWKSTGVCLPEQQKAAHKLLAFCEMLENKFGESPAASFFERWLAPSCVITMLEIYHHGHTDLALEYASKRMTAEQVLDLYDPKWRDVPPSMFEIATNPDGELYITMKGDEVG